MTRHIPNLFTLLNLIFGCLAIVATLQNGIVIQYNTDGTQLIGIPEKIWMASLFIGLAALVDFLDGFVARLFNASSAMGKQLDSLADVVSFGVAPAMILYQFLRMSIAQEEDGLNASIIWLLPAFILAAAGAWRLAKFNLDNSQSYGFKGVPIPAVGLMVASLPLIYWNNNSQLIVDILFNKWLLYGLIILLSWLMVSNLPMMALKFKDFTVKNNLPKFILLAVAIIAALFLQWLAVPLVFIIYIILSLLFKQKQP
ncbi:MAG: CDP-diacylglycerol--serine O-phosphatidyltransferase [Ferruginibacter sp.]|nr:CDP-diacylglycerol--serine O-phosphatidyltransferase [Bacteroidota bacterium]MBX2919100.1 CDP-diacylglycerol--serine O-phosphatidyltransferase [Ferruginibacter sp.]MCB0709883.1 CDP-diacylglycerol--serine O-phosphatidyltransferase [Chitinophagaceae bacterium]